jgi:hypothetical protein
LEIPLHIKDLFQAKKLKQCKNRKEISLAARHFYYQWTQKEKEKALKRKQNVVVSKPTESAPECKDWSEAKQ